MTIVRDEEVLAERPPQATPATEALIREARRHRRRRLAVTALVAAVLGAGTLIVVTRGHARAPSHERPPGTVTTPVATAVPCSVTQLTLLGDVQLSQATEQDASTVTVVNSSGTACALDGYPRVLLFGPSGRPSRLAFCDCGDQEVSARQPTEVRLEPRSKAYFAVNRQSCVLHTATEVTAIRIAVGDGPGVSNAVPLANPMLVCVPGDPARNTVDVSPFAPTVHATLRA